MSIKTVNLKEVLENGVSKLNALESDYMYLSCIPEYTFEASGVNKEEELHGVQEQIDNVSQFVNMYLTSKSETVEISNDLYDFIMQ